MDNLIYRVKINNKEKIKIDRILLLESNKKSEANVKFLNWCRMHKIASFDMDSKVQDGRLALLYKNTYKKPQIWFQVIFYREYEYS